MRKRTTSSDKRMIGGDERFKTVDEAFLRFFPSTVKERGRLRRVESGTELAERLFAKASHLQKT